MSALTGWLLSVIGTAFLVAIAEALIREEKVRQVGRLVGGLLMLLALLSPLGHLQPGEWTLSLETYFSQVAEKEQSYRQAQEDTVGALIKERSEAYIAGAAHKLGLEACPKVGLAAAEEGEIPRPDAVEMDIPYHAALAAQIEEELGIRRERQTWQDKEAG